MSLTVVSPRAVGVAIPLSNGLQLSRRGSSFSPASIPGGVLWLRADGVLWQDFARTVPAVLDGDPVGCADDAFNLGNNLIQATLAKRPLLKLGILNGHPVIRFDGVDDFLARAALVIPQPFTVVVVASSTSAATFRMLVGSTAVQLFLNTTHHMVVFAGTSVTSATVDDGAPHVFTAIYNGATSSLFVDGTLGPSGAAGAGATDQIVVGANAAGAQDWPGDVEQVIIYNRVLSAAEHQQLERSLGTKDGITVA